jgi:hypothetical protein
MTRNIRIKRIHLCPVEQCQFFTGNRMILQNHIKEGHDIKEQLAASLTKKGWDLRNE